MSVWPFIPQREITEREMWKTEVIRCRDGEQHIRLRDLPRTQFVHKYILLPSQIQAAIDLARAYDHSDIVTPIWADHENVGDVANGTYADCPTKQFRDRSFKLIYVATSNSGPVTWTIRMASAITYPSGVSASQRADDGYQSIKKQNPRCPHRRHRGGRR